jgi:exodeoxyribonuclease V alpha subunit
VLTSLTGQATARLKGLELDKIRPLFGGADESYVITGNMHLLLTTKQSFNNIGIIIIDEISMAQSELVWKFLTAVYKDCGYYPSVLFVGDVHQLEPIGWGWFFTQIVASVRIPKAYLTINHRSCKGILNNANNFLQGKDFEQETGFTIMDLDPLVVWKHVHDHRMDVRVITPYVNEVQRLNSVIQTILHPPDQSTSGFVADDRGVKWYRGDIVVMCVNSYKIGIMNGEEGIIINISETFIEIVFKGTTEPKKYLLSGASRTEEELRGQEDTIDEHDYDGDVTTACLLHAYSLTAHKSQGCEYQFVIFHVPTSKYNSGFLTKNLVYTAITRGKEGVACTGDIDALNAARSRVAPPRFDMLRARIDA